ncbi:DUF2197 domain-containing protein [Effusibacillus lacus]|uniref:DUF2197 domain-containing protein n=1 Tax=Effusibacillus lacus TaxID=1348429 RepID=A0A292YQH6_9BACL|nr:DUF2197 domain-containing protein [Effusibacillus lacus]TCS76047.1 hypothetical protein EDD64_10418 [Effusibacillus lacus]GAX91436.1 hypothetical protein EFBL_3105 [Effusibacillus lacus]
MSDYLLRCSLCGVTSEAQETDATQVQTAKENHVYICPACQAKIKFESDQKYK